MDNTEIKQIAELRAKVTSLGVDVVDLRSEMEQTEEGEKFVAILDAHKEAKEELIELENSYKFECKTAYIDTAEKKHPGGQVKIYKEVQYFIDHAMDWAIKGNHAGVLKLDRTAFRKVALVLEPDFVTVVETPKMTLASDLSEFLKE